jgi:hypothetical protein
MSGAGGEDEQNATNPSPCHRTDTSESFAWDHCLAYDNQVILALATVLEISRKCNRIDSDTINRETGSRYDDGVEAHDGL